MTEAGLPTEITSMHGQWEPTLAIVQGHLEHAASIVRQMAALTTQSAAYEGCAEMFAEMAGSLAQIADRVPEVNALTRTADEHAWGMLERYGPTRARQWSEPA